MKSILLISILLLSGCSQYRYDVNYEKCNGQTGSMSYVWLDEPYIYNKKLAVPELRINNNARGWKLEYNVCDFSYTRSEITK